MYDIRLKPTEELPLVDGINGNLIIEGAIKTRNTKEMFDSIKKWIKEVDCNIVEVEVDLHEIEEKAVKGLLEIFHCFTENEIVDELIISWNYTGKDTKEYKIGRKIEAEMPLGVEFEFFHSRAQMAF